LDLSKWISKNDALMMLEIINRSLFCKTNEDFLELMEDFKKLINFECSFNGWAEIKSILNNQKANFHFINGGYPEEYLNIYFDQGYHQKDPVIQKYFETFEVQSFIDIERGCIDEQKNPVIGMGYDFGVVEGFVYGVCDNDYYSATSLFLAGRHVENNQRSRLIIKHIVPHLSTVINRLLPFPVNGKIFRLTKTETEILKWFKEGKTSWETSLILNKSERAIKFHTDNILKKLNAMNKTHAVAIALENHLIEL
jgi:LuxR family transcriptional regulator, quorum-sensing system regulator CviR